MHEAGFVGDLRHIDIYIYIYYTGKKDSCFHRYSWFLICRFMSG